LNSQLSTLNHQLIDTHAHLDYPDFASDFEEVLRRATEAGVTRVLTIGTSIESSQRAVESAEKYSNVYAVIGVHPTVDDGSAEDVMSPLRELAKSPRVVAIGETGLDYHRLPSEKLLKPLPAYIAEQPLNDPVEPNAAVVDGAYKSRQAGLFQQQLDLAVELNLNVVIHQRDAWDATLEIMEPYGRTFSGVFHCFGGSLEQANEVIALGHLVSFTGIVTFKNGAQVRHVAARVPVDKFMVETDCPYLAPVPFRGKRCEPAHTRLVAEEIAKARNVSIEEIARATTATAEEFFKFGR
jgi:TatD DNase family protein